MEPDVTLIFRHTSLRAFPSKTWGTGNIPLHETLEVPLQGPARAFCLRSNHDTIRLHCCQL